VLALPKQYERERRFINLYRQHDILRRFNDDEYERFIHYMQGSINLVLDVMQSEKEARLGKSTPAAAAKKGKAESKTGARAPSKRKAAPRKRKRAPAASRRPRS
jgi:hypothetical protein